MAAALLLSTTACDKGDAGKGDAGKGDDGKAVAAAETGTEVAVDPAAATVTAGAPADEVDDETDGEAETGGAPAAGETPPDDADDDDDDDDDDGDDKPAPATKTTTTKTVTKTVEPAKPAEPIAKVDAKPLYEQKCKSCHGSDGKGDTTIGKKVDIPSLAKTTMAKAKIVSTIEKGVPDTKMKGYKGKLTDDEIDAIAGYVLKL